MPSIDETSRTSSARTKTMSNLERKLSQEERLIKRQIEDIDDQLLVVRDKIKNLPPIKTVYEAPSSPKGKDKKRSGLSSPESHETLGKRLSGEEATATTNSTAFTGSSPSSTPTSSSLLRHISTNNDAMKEPVRFNEDDDHSCVSYQSFNEKYLYKDYGGKRNSNIMMHLLDKMPVIVLPPKSSHRRPLCFQVPGSDSTVDADQLSLSRASTKSTPKSLRRSIRRSMHRSDSFSSDLNSPVGSTSLLGNDEIIIDGLDFFDEIETGDASCDDLSFDENIPEKFVGLEEFTVDDSGESSIALVLVDIVEGKGLTDGFKSLTEPVVTLHLGSHSEQSSPFFLGNNDTASWNEQRAFPWNGKDRLRVVVGDRVQSPVTASSHYIGTCLDLGKCNLGVTSEIHEELGNMIFVDSRVHARIGEKKFGKITIKITIKGVVFPQGIQNDKEFVAMKTRSRQERVEIDTG